MATSQSGRQTVLREYLTDFPFRVSTGSGRTHFVHEDDVVGGVTGKTYCGRFHVRASYPRTALAALSAARNPCALCLRRISDGHLETVAAMATACSHDHITVADIRDTDD